MEQKQEQEQEQVQEQVLQEQQAAGWQKMLAIQGALEAVVPARTKGHRDMMYVSLPDLLSIVRPVLTQHRVVLVQEGGFEEGRSVLTTRLVDADTGTTLSFSVWSLPESASKHMSADQAAGSSITYFRRYAILSQLGICGSDELDPDARTQQAASGAASGASAPRRIKPAPKAAPPTKEQIDAFSGYCRDLIERGVLDKEQVNAACRLNGIGKDATQWTVAQIDQARAALASKALSRSPSTPPHPAAEAPHAPKDSAPSRA